MSYALLGETTPVARKDHKCCWCGELILCGEKYLREKSVYDGRMQDHRWHFECHEAAARFFRASHDGEFDLYGNPRGREPEDWPEDPEEIPIAEP
jgi:hypothetical protein